MDNKPNKAKQVATKGKDALTKNPVSKGLLFLGKAVISQWKVLCTITAIFLVIVFVLSSLTMCFDLATSKSDFNITEEDGTNIRFWDAFWWVYVTISTIGYGDLYPVTGFMRFWAIIISLIGMSFIALYTAVVVDGFTKQLQANKKNNALQINELELEEELLKDKIKKLEQENKELKTKLKNIHKS